MARTALLPLLALLAAGPRSAAAEPPAAAGASAGGGEVAAHGAGGCNAILDQYYATQTREPAPHQDGAMVYFLHIPRTAGRTLHSCLLKRGTHPSRRCPESYDRLRLDQAPPGGCVLLSSHDDFSAAALLPPGAAAATQLRGPLQRFLSAYEFAATTAMHRVRGAAPKNAALPPGAREPFTWEVWPWSHLVPLFVDDITARAAAMERDAAGDAAGRWVEVAARNGTKLYLNRATNNTKLRLSDAERARLLTPLDPYDNPLLMPLREFEAHPMAAELLHNGQAYQVLGITNNSQWAGAAALRRCAEREPPIAEELLSFAKRRLAAFSHVGTLERLQESVEAAAASLGLDLEGPAYAIRRYQEGQQVEGQEEAPEDAPRRQRSGGGGGAQAVGQDAVLGAPLGAAWHRCSRASPGRDKRRQARALSRVPTAYGPLSVEFSKAAREQVPATVADEIRRRNHMDEELYEFAQSLLENRTRDLAARGLLKRLPLPPPPAAGGAGAGGAQGGKRPRARHTRPGLEERRRQQQQQQQEEEEEDKEQQQEQQQEPRRRRRRRQPDQLPDGDGGADEL